MKKLLLLAAFMVLITPMLQAQTANLKIGHINSALILQAMPEKAKADSEVVKYTKSFQDEIDLMIKDGQAKGQEYQANEKTMSDAMKEVKMKEIQDLQSRLESIQQSAQEKVQQKKSDLWEPIIEKVNKAIKEVAKEKNYDYIFDVAGGGTLVYQKEEHDITNLVKAKLGLK